MTCVRRAWLTLDDGSSIDLEDVAAGYFCTSLDLGSPTVREVANNRPDRDGIDDRTRLFGARLISAAVTALDDAGATIDAVATSFGPYMTPNARPTLHYVLDRPGAPERVLTVRGAAYTWKLEGASQRDISLQWVAADPVAYDPAQRVVTAFAGTVAGAGRAYDLRYPRTYPTGTQSPTSSTIHGDGDLPVQPLLRIYGPITEPTVTIRAADGTLYVVGFLSSFSVGAGAFVEVDTAARTAYYLGDPAQPVLAQLDWTTLAWPVLPPGADHVMTLAGSASGAGTQVQAIWQDGYYA
jgi:hypothetical protein